MATQKEALDLDLVVFDITGTVIANTDAVADAFRSALWTHGIRITAEEVQPWRGASKRPAIRSLIESRSSEAPSEDQIEKVYADFRDALWRRFETEGLRPIPGAEATFAWLRARGARLALNTGYDRDIADLILGTLKWDQGMVDAVVCGNEVVQGRPAPFMIFRAMEQTGVTNVRRVAVVGDTALDLEAGWNAGAGRIIGVLSGAHGRDRLARAPHTDIVGSVADLPGLWEQWSSHTGAP